MGRIMGVETRGGGGGTSMMVTGGGSRRRVVIVSETCRRECECRRPEGRGAKVTSSSQAGRAGRRRES